MKSLLTSALALLACCIPALAQEPELVPAQEPEPELAARVDVNSIMRLTQKAGVFADKVQPKSSGLLILGMVGLTVNPQMANYDLSKPFTVLACSDPNGIAGPWGFCGVFWRRGEMSRPFMKIGGFNLTTKDMEGRAAIASSKAILDKIPEDLTKNPASAPAPGTPDLSVWLDAKNILKDGVLQKLAANPDLQQAAKLSPEKLESLQAAEARLQAETALLRQLSALKATLAISDDNHAKIALRLEPSPGGGLEAFLKSRNGRDAFPCAIRVKEAAIYGAIAAKFDEKLAKAIALQYGKKAEATGDGARAAAFTKFVAQLLTESVEGPGFCAGQHANKAFGAASMRLKAGACARLETALASFAAKTATPHLFRLREWKSGISSYCLLDDERAWLLSGRFDDSSADETLSMRRVLPAAGAEEPELLAYATFDATGELPKPLTVYADGNSLDFNLEFTPADLDSLPLPLPQPSQRNVIRIAR